MLAIPLVAQPSVRLTQEAPFLKEPGGVRLATVAAAVRVTPGRRSGDYVEVTLNGWVFTTSTRADARDGFDLSVSAAGGENLRDAPDGNRIAKAVEGALFSRAGSRKGWTAVRRTGWIPVSALPAPAQAPADTRSGSRPPRESVTVAPKPAPPPAQTEPAAARRGTLRRGVSVAAAPDGPAIAALTAPAEVAVLANDRDWVKVRLEGWVRASEVDGAVNPRPTITAQMLRDNPDRYVGQTVEWRLQFLARQQADELRPEMPLGHAYLLTRGPLPESGFVYVMVTKEQAAQFEGTKPLDELTLTVTVRAGRTRYLATPVVELVKVGAK